MPTNIGNGRITEDGIARIAPADVERLSQHELKLGDVVFSRRGDVTKNALIRAREVGWLCGTGCLKVRLGSESIASSKFVSHYLRLPQIKEWLNRHAVGATMPNLNTAILSAVPLVLPPFTAQLEIAEVLDDFDNRISLLFETNATLEAIAQALFKSWFVDFDPVCAKMEGRVPESMDEAMAAMFPDNLVNHGQASIPRGWNCTRLDSILELAYGKALKATDRMPGDVPVYGSGGVTGYHDEALVQGPGIVIGRKGTVGSLFWEDRPFYPIDTVFYVRSNAPLVYCFELLRTLPLSDMNTDAAVPGLNRNNVYRLEVVHPPAHLLAAYDAICAPLRARLATNCKLAATLELLRDTLLPRLISGKLRLPDAESLVSHAAGA